MHRSRWLPWLFAVFGVLIAAGAAVVLMSMPAMAAYICPSCYGLKPISDQVFVDRAMTATEITEIQSMLVEAEDRVRDFYGSFDRTPTLLICATDACDRRLGGKGAKARAYGSAFLFVSPPGRNATMLAHEFSHIELHARVGDFRLMQGVVPAWFDEGIAVIVSQDQRYLRVDQQGGMHCLAEPQDELPTTPREWGREAGQKARPIYAMATCRVLRWMEVNGGSSAVQEAIARMAQGHAPEL